MSMTTIRIPDKQAAKLRESLNAIRQEVDRAEAAPDRPQRRDDVEALLQQFDSAVAAEGTRTLQGSHVVLWNAVYDGLCGAAEHFAADCNEIWRGNTDLAETQQQLHGVGEWLALLASLGAPPTEAL
jgi:hypothetical protein